MFLVWVTTPTSSFGYGSLRDSVAVSTFGNGHVPAGYRSPASSGGCSLLFLSFSRLERLTPLGSALSTCFDLSFRVPSEGPPLSPSIEDENPNPYLGSSFSSRPPLDPLFLAPLLTFHPRMNVGPRPGSGSMAE